MPKYIDADALNAELDKVFEGTDYEFDNDLLNDVLSAVDNAPAADVEPKQRWIPVTERLPDAEDHYLAAYKLANGEAFCDILYYGFMDFKADEGMCFYKYDSEWGDVKYDGVTHWMRMPEIPKEEDDG